MDLPPRRIPPLGPPKRTPLEQVLAEWHGMDVAALEKEHADAAKPVGALMERVVKSLKLEKRREELEILRVWQEMIDPAITAHAQPAGIRNGTLFIKVDSHVWRDEIERYRRAEILSCLQHSFGKNVIKRLAFTVG